MTKRKKKYPRCPCCKKDRNKTEMKFAIAEQERIEKTIYKHYKEMKVDTYGYFVDSHFDWACDPCLHSKKAIQAKTSVQNYCWNPFFAYFDTNYTCRTCQEDFVFRKEEKKYWFENLKFWIDSRPVNCVDCRKEIRQLKNENSVLSKVLSKKEEEMDRAELEKVIDIYTKWEKTEKAKYYQAVLRKRK